MSEAGWRMRAWSYDPTVALVIFTDLSAPPAPDAIAAAVDRARQRGARLLRTSAVTATSADRLAAHGFVPLDRLALLRLDLTGALAEPRHRVRSLRRADYRAAAAVDLAAFGPLWANDTAALRDIRNATPLHRARVITAGSFRRISGFAIAGVGATSGYLQRLAVAPDARRRGIARDLVLDGAHWMRRVGASTALVNTGLHNTAALALYDGLGFVRLPADLTIYELDLRP